MTDTHGILAAGAWAERRPRVQLLRWNDEAGRAEPCETFEAVGERT